MKTITEKAKDITGKPFEKTIILFEYFKEKVNTQSHKELFKEETFEGAILEGLMVMCDSKCSNCPIANIYQSLYCEFTPFERLEETLSEYFCDELEKDNLIDSIDRCICLLKELRKFEEAKELLNEVSSFLGEHHLLTEEAYSLYYNINEFLNKINKK